MPIYSIDLDNFSLPISIDYHASGIRVSEISSSVGLGWALNAGGLISCTVNGISDLDSNYGHVAGGNAKVILDAYKRGDLQEAANGAHTSGATFPYYQLIKSLATGGEDTSPDVFNFNFAGRAGMFVFDEDQVPRVIPFQPIEIGFNGRDSFSIKDESGNVFKYSEVEYASISSVGSGGCDLTDWFYAAENFTPTWYISEITTYKQEKISFYYENIAYSYKLPANETWTDWLTYPLIPYNPGVREIGCTVQFPKVTCQQTMHVERGKRLIKIQSSDGRTIDFKYGPTTRIDLPGTNQLAEIVVKDKVKTLKRWILDQDYFVDRSTGDNNAESFALKLLSVKEVGKPAYRFEYNSVFSGRAFMGQEYFGFNNGVYNNTLVPAARIASGKLFDGANREVNPLTVQAATLNKIYYPTGGTVCFPK